MRTPLCSALLFGFAVAVSSPAAAQESKPTAPVPAAVAPFAGEAVQDGTLGQVAGREDVNQHAIANLNAGVSRNSVGDNSTTGDARIDGNAFQNLSGLSILNVNTGNNVAINAAMNVNISISPTP